MADRRDLPSHLLAIQGAMRQGDTARASALAEQALADGHEHPQILTLAAYRRWEANAFDGALSAASRAVELAPDLIDALSVQGQSLVALRRPADAVNVFERASRLSPGEVDLQFSLGNALEQSGQIQRAINAFERVLRLDPEHAEAAARLADMLVSRGRTAEARGFAERARAIDPRHANANCTLAAADVEDGRFEEARQRLVGIIATPKLGRPIYALAHSILGDALNGLGRTDEAFEAYTQSGEMFKTIYAFPPGAEDKTALARARRIAAYMSRTPEASWVWRPDPRKRARAHVFVTGFARSGTTLLSHVLGAHPAIETLDEKPLLEDSFDLPQTDEGLERLASLDDAALASLRESYWRRAATFGFHDADKVLVDKAPLHSEILCLIAKLFPDAKIVFAIRDPRDVVLSCFRRYFAMTRSNYELLTLESTATYYDAVMSLCEICREKLALPFLDLRNEDLVTDFEGQTRRLFDFIGLEGDAAVARFAERARSRDIATPGATKIMRGLNSDSIGQWRAYREQFAPVLPLLDRWVRRFGYAVD
jgi:tetratricopeptide (TPR) repeat protein